MSGLVNSIFEDASVQMNRETSDIIRSIERRLKKDNDDWRIELEETGVSLFVSTGNSSSFWLYLSSKSDGKITVLRTRGRNLNPSKVFDYSNIRSPEEWTRKLENVIYEYD